MRLQPEPGETVVGADAVDLQRPIVVAREGPARHEIHDKRLQPRHDIRQADDPAAPAGELGNELDYFAQRVDLRAAQLISLAAGRAAMQTGSKGFDHVVDEYRLKSRIGLGQRKNSGDGAEESREAVQERVAGSENHRGLEDGPIERGIRLADQLLRFTLGAQIIARRVNGGLERGNLQQPCNPGRSGRLQHSAGQFGVNPPESRAAETALIEDADEVDHDVLAAEVFAQLRFVEHIAVQEAEPRQHQQVLVLLAVPRQHRHPAPILDQSGDQPGSQKSGAAENDYAVRTHPINGSESAARPSRGGR